MSDYIDTREAWKVGVTGQSIPGEEYIEHVAQDGTFTRYFRESPVPPLPNVPYTVILTKGKRGFSDWVMIWYGEQWHQSANGTAISAAELSNLIISFEVLSEPRAVTAKAVLGRLLSRLEAEGIKVTNIGEWIDMTGREFGVES